MHDHEHDHSVATHSMTCPAEGCEFNVEVHAHNDDEAVMRIAAGGAEHMAAVHPDAEMPEQNQMMAMIRENMVSL